MDAEVRKISFDEAWNTMTVFFIDNQLEDEIDQEVEEMLAIAGDKRLHEDAEITSESITAFITENVRGLDVILRDIGLSDEKFMRIVTLLRRLGRIPGGFLSEWHITQVKRQIKNNVTFANQITTLLVEGIYDETLKSYIPRYYLEKLNYRKIGGSSLEARRVRYKHALIGTYSGRKGYCVEQRISQTLRKILDEHGIGYEKGRSRFVDTDIDFAIPTLADPWVIVMCSFQETTSSGQTTKARDMLTAYERVQRSNSRYGENRIFINYVDGGRWLARKRDLERW